MEKLIVPQDAISTYVNLLKNKFGTNLGQVIEEVLFDDLNMDFKLPKTWNDEEFAKWAKMDITWNFLQTKDTLVGYEGEEIGVEYVRDLFEASLQLSGIEDYFI